MNVRPLLVSPSSKSFQFITNNILFNKLYIFLMDNFEEEEFFHISTSY